jgi:hypothetical protein
MPPKKKQKTTNQKGKQSKHMKDNNKAPKKTKIAAYQYQFIVLLKILSIFFGFFRKYFNTTKGG